MTPEEQNTFLSKEYAEAIRYMDNAKETLKRAEKRVQRRLSHHRQD
jgi:exonuclease VII small subunit